MIGYFINESVGYYEGDQISPADQVVTRRPDPSYTWDGGAWQPTTATHNAPILTQISGLEATVTERRIREAILGIDGGWLAGVNAQIATLRGTLTK